MRKMIAIGGVFACLTAQPALAEIHPLVGTMKTVKVQKKETLDKIARREDVNVEFLRKLNHLKSSQAHPGQTLLLPTLRILPRFPKDGIVLNIPERQLYLFKGGQFLKDYPVAVGMASWPTEIGQFQLTHKVVNPQWKPTKEMLARTEIKDEPVPPGKDNPIGDRWMGWSKPGYGFHSTTRPETIGKVISHGCVRLFPESAHKMFDQVTEGETIYSLYEPVLLGERDGKFFLSVFPDIYNKKNGGLNRIKLILQKEGLITLVNMKEVAQIASRQEGYPRRILGEDRSLAVNGQKVKTEVAPVQVNGHWIVALKPLAETLGGQMTAGSDGSRKITGNGHTLTLKPGQKSAKLDGHALALSFAPVEVKGTLLAPAALLTNLFGAKLTALKGKPLDFVKSASPKPVSQKPQAHPKIGARPVVPARLPSSAASEKRVAALSKQNKELNRGKSGNATLSLQSDQEISEARQSGARLIAALQKGKMKLLNESRDRSQLAQLASQGFYHGPDGKTIVFPAPLLRLLEHLANRSSPQHPLVVMSLSRPLQANRPGEPHGNGMAVDIAAYNGHRIESRRPEEAVAGVLAVIQALEPGEYRLGLPKPPVPEPVALLPPPPRPAAWPFFPAPVPAVLPLIGTEIVKPRFVNSELIQDRKGQIEPEIVQWENERGAPLSDIGDTRLRQAIQTAVNRGANIYSLFPDAPDHLHLDVRPVK